MSQSHKKNSRETVANTSIFSFFTVISRVLGLARDAIKAYAFGTTIFAVAFDIAFRLPNMLRNLVAEGALSQSFLPVYESYKDPHWQVNQPVRVGQGRHCAGNDIADPGG